MTQVRNRSIYTSSTHGRAYIIDSSHFSLFSERTQSTIPTRPSTSYKIHINIYNGVLPYGIAVDTAKAVDTAVVLQFYFMSTAKMQ
jgi:hypothetical protein